ncbi:uncharacterized protein LOC123298664 [Chrysoperla carnea]|uniref:uncharacterized protein LOC123298664 n=1 Tax=Chrysoperla carnea TaxID=189513 RepID=UPI001D092DF0|nr:uncharacterized protein LOC123298664 [Chrysoperla carnea]
MENTFNNITNNIPSSSAFESYSTQFTNNFPANTVDNASQNFVPYFGFMMTDQYKSLMRLIHLFPQLHAATLKGALELCNYDSIQTIDSILYALQYRKYLEAKNQGFPLDYSARCPRTPLLPSFLGNRTTNSHVYEQLFQDNAYFNNVPTNGGGDMNNFGNCYTPSPGVSDTSANKSNFIPQYFTGYQISNDTGAEQNFQMPGNCLPPFTHLAQCSSSNQNSESGMRYKLVNWIPSLVPTRKSDKENVTDGGVINQHPPAVANTGRQSAVHEDKRTIKPAKVKRVIKTKQATSRPKSLEKKTVKLLKASDFKNTEEIKNPSNVDDTKPEIMDMTMRNCMVVESTSQIGIKYVIKKSQCPLGDKDCNEIFQPK